MRLSAPTILLFAATTLHAANPVSGFYAGGFVGPSYEPDIKFNISDPTGALQALSVSSSTASLLTSASNNKGSLGFDVLVNAGGQLGFRFCDNFRLELEALYNKNPYSFLHIGDVSIHTNPKTTGLYFTGYTASGMGFINAYYDFLGQGDNDLVPYVGLGIGYAYIYNAAKFFFDNTLVNPSGTSITTHATRPVGQVILGASYYMDDFFSVGIDIRGYSTTSGILTTRSGKTYTTQLKVASVNFIFNGALEFG